MATSSADLRLPDELSGPWEHALIVSYGLDLPFFERALLRQLAPSCRNRILLGDERTYLASCDAYAETALVRAANRTYVAEPILRRASSHAKVILLTTPTAGRLLVGSGNVSRQGFASGGELFTRYSYDATEPAALPEFVTVRALLERLRDDGLLTRTAGWHVDRLLEGTPWLYSGATDAQPRVRHNLDRCLAEQLTDAIAGEPVEELVLLAPFFDPELAALRDLIDRLDPDETTVLVQPARTSIDPGVLGRVRANADRLIVVRPFERPPEQPWVHAKLIVAKTTNGAVCLQGSANVSLAALLRTASDGNLEVVNLLRGDRDAFDAVVGELDIGGVADDLTALELRYEQSEDDDHLADEGWQLTAAEWSDGVLEIRYRGEMPPLHGASIESAGLTFALEIVRELPGAITVRLTSASGEQLHGVTPLRLVLADGHASNAIFAADRDALVRALELGADSGEKLARVGDLGLDDDELEQLLQELEATLVIDQRSLWQIRGETRPPEVDGDEEPRIDYSEVDYEMLRSHPKMQQYLRGERSLGGPRSRLQIVLNAITSAFSDLAVADSAAAIADQALAADPAGEAGSVDPQEEEDDEDRPRRRWSAEARLNVLFGNFVKRFLRGLGSREFQDIAGPDVLSRNYVVFFHLLSRLAEREWIDQRFVVTSLTRTIEIFWGTKDAAGYVQRLDERDRSEVLGVIRETRNDAQLIATLYTASRETRIADLEELRIALRDAWRGILVHRDAPLTSQVLGDARIMLRGTAPPDGPPLAAIIEELYDLSEFVTRDELVAGLAARLGVRDTACTFVSETVRTPWLGTANVETLRVEDDAARLDIDDAQWAIQTWTAVERQRHYRVAVTSRDGRNPRFVAFYEPAARQGRYASLTDRTGAVPLVSFGVTPTPWDDGVTALMEAADAAAGVESDTAAG